MGSACRRQPGRLGIVLGVGAAVLAGSAVFGEPVATPMVRTVIVGVVTNKGEVVSGLTPDEVTLKEDGKKREVISVEPEEGPLEIALILDSSARMGQDYRSVLVDSAMAFWRALPPGTKLSIWTSGGRSSKIVDREVAQEEGENLLKQVAAANKNYTLDAIVDSCKELARSAALRRAVVVVTLTEIEANKTLIQEAYTEIAQARALPFIILVKPGAVTGQLWDTETVFKQMTEGYGGTEHIALTPLASRKLLAWTAADLVSQYRVRYATEADKPTHPEVKIQRKGTKVQVRVGLSQKTH
jgi:hypothetical protein